MPDQKTIDRVCVGLAEMTSQEMAWRRHRIETHLDGPWVAPPFAYHLLCLSLDIPEPIPDWAEHALESHTGTPEELVATLRELAARAGPNAFARSLRRIDNHPE